ELFLKDKLGWIEDNIAACMKLSECYGHLQKADMQLSSLLHALTYDAPRAELCCKLGTLFMRRGQHAVAIYWFLQATQLTMPMDNMNSRDHASWTWFPHLQLTVNYDKMGDMSNALKHHNIAKAMNPVHPS